MANLSLKNIYKVYPGNVTAVHDFNLEIEDKDFIVFVGPSGCGKSTTLRMIAGLEDISSGDLLIDGKVVNDMSPKDRDIAMVFQNYALYPHLTVYENMGFGLKLRKESKEVIDQKVREAAKFLDIEHLLDRKPKALSGGQRQRVAMGRALVREAKVFLLDEPLSNLDAKLRVQMRTEIAKLHQKLQTTFIYVTHDQTEAMTLGTKIVVMRDGLIQQVASPKEIYDHPANMFVAGFIGSPQMNFLYGNVVEHNNSLALQIFDSIVELKDTQAAALRNAKSENKDVIIGVRPENVLIGENIGKKHSSSVLKGKIEVIENLGSEVILYVLLGDKTVTIKTSSEHEFSVGDSLDLSFDISKLHVFEKEEQTTIF